MQKTKLCFWLTWVLVAGLCACIRASDKDQVIQHKMERNKSFILLQEKVKKPLFSPLGFDQKRPKAFRKAGGTGAISGQVTQASGGDPIEGVTIRAEQLTCPSDDIITYSDSDGFYIIEGLPPGNYQVCIENDSDFVDICWDNKDVWETPDTVEVFVDDTTENIDFSLRVGGRIAGVVHLQGSTIHSATVYAYNTTSGQVYSILAYGMGEDAPYIIKRLPEGTYKVKTTNYMGYIDVYYNNQSSWETANPVSVPEGVTTSDIDFILSPGGTIQGTISGVKGSFQDLIVIGYYASNPEWYSIAWGLKNDGSYQLMGLRNGGWKIFAYGDTSKAFEWYNDKGNWDEADSVSVTAPQTVSGIDFTLEMGGSISGYVYSSEKGPLSGCNVIAYESDLYQWGTSTLAFWAKTETTSTDGSYKIGGLRTGDYYVVAMTECDVIWYDNQSTPEQADLVHVDMPDETSGINFNFPSAVENQCDQQILMPSEFELSQNYPNPFNPGTEIQYTLRRPGQVILQIYNLLGQKVKTLINEYQSPGFYQVPWDGKNEEEEKVGSGIYFYRLQVNNVSQTRKMILLR